MTASRSTPTSDRLFYALELPAELRDGLAAWSAPAVAMDPALRAVAGARLHVTLLFLGDVSADERARLGAALIALAPRAVTLAVRGLVGIPRRRPRLFAAEHAACGAEELRSELIARLTAAGLPHGDPEQIERPFWPHTTLLRTRRAAVANLVAERFEAPPEALRGEHDVVRVCLYRSNKSSGGSPGEAYEPLAGLELPRSSDDQAGRTATKR